MQENLIPGQAKKRKRRERQRENRQRKRGEEKDESPHKFTGGVTFISDYRSRGLSQTMCRPAVQGEMTYTHKSGIYFKIGHPMWMAPPLFLNDACLEWDIYLGYLNKIMNTEFKFDVGLEYYYYPGARAPVPRQPS